MPLYPRRGVLSDKRGFDRYRSAACKTVDKRTILVPYRQHYYCRGKRFFHRRKPHYRAVSPFVQPFAGRIQTYRNFVVRDVYFDVIRRAAFTQRFDFIFPFQPFDNRLFCDFLDCRQRIQRRFIAFCIDGNARVLFKNILKRIRNKPVEKLVKSRRLERKKIDVNVICRP